LRSSKSTFCEAYHASVLAAPFSGERATALDSLRVLYREISFEDLNFSTVTVILEMVAACRTAAAVSALTGDYSRFDY
jgi:hypothetical protein